jgi:hypothetical protein
MMGGQRRLSWSIGRSKWLVLRRRADGVSHRRRGRPDVRRGSYRCRRQDRFLSIRLREDTSIIRHGRPMVDGFTCPRHSRHSANGPVEDCRERRATGTPHLSRRVLWVPDPDRRSHVLYIAKDHDGSARGCGRSIPPVERPRRVAYGAEQYLSIAAVPTIVISSRRWPIQVRALWTVPILDHPAEDGDATPMVLPTCGPSRRVLPRGRCFTCPRRARVTAVASRGRQGGGDPEGI